MKSVGNSLILVALVLLTYSSPTQIQAVQYDVPVPKLLHRFHYVPRPEDPPVEIGDATRFMVGIHFDTGTYTEPTPGSGEPTISWNAWTKFRRISTFDGTSSLTGTNLGALNFDEFPNPLGNFPSLPNGSGLYNQTYIVGSSPIPAPFISQTPTLPNSILDQMRVNSLTTGDALVRARLGDYVVVWTLTTMAGTMTATNQTTKDVFGRLASITRYKVTELGLKVASIDSRELYGNANAQGQTFFDPNTASRHQVFMPWDYRGGLFSGYAQDEEDVEQKDRSGKAMVMCQTNGQDSAKDEVTILSLFYTGSVSKYPLNSTNGTPFAAISRENTGSLTFPLPPAEFQWRGTYGSEPRVAGWGMSGEEEFLVPNNFSDASGFDANASLGSILNFKPQPLTTLWKPASFNISKTAILHFIRPVNLVNQASWAYFASETYLDSLQPEGGNSIGDSISPGAYSLRKVVRDSMIPETGGIATGAVGGDGHRSSTAWFSVED